MLVTIYSYIILPVQGPVAWAAETEIEWQCCLGTQAAEQLGVAPKIAARWAHQLRFSACAAGAARRWTLLSAFLQSITARM